MAPIESLLNDYYLSQAGLDVSMLEEALKLLEERKYVQIIGKNVKFLR